MKYYWFADLVSGVIIPRVRLKQVVPGGELEGHAGRGPDVGRGVVAGAQEDLQGPVLPGLDVLRVVVRHPAGVAQVGYLALQVRHDLMDWILGTEQSIQQTDKAITYLHINKLNSFLSSLYRLIWTPERVTIEAPNFFSILKLKADVYNL